MKELDRCIEALFRALGLPVLHAPGEAEALCAALQCTGLVDACATKDSDALVFGATHVFHTINLVVHTPSTTDHLSFRFDLKLTPQHLHLYLKLECVTQHKLSLSLTEVSTLKAPGEKRIQRFSKQGHFRSMIQQAGKLQAGQSQAQC